MTIVWNEFKNFIAKNEQCKIKNQSSSRVMKIPK